MNVWQVTSVTPPRNYRYGGNRRITLAPEREEETLTQPDTQNQIDHIAYVVDASSSMEERTEETITVIDNQTAFLAQMSKQTGRETRVTIYIFSDARNIKCVVFDRDVLRLPSIREFYKPFGWTALLDATGLAIEDLKLTMQKYGDHAFLLFAFTDGDENRSQRHSAYSLADLIRGLGLNWTVAALVPDINGRLMARRFGFPDGNISIWNVNSSTGVQEAGETMKDALSAYSGLRSAGGQGTRTLFSTSSDAVNAATIKAAGLVPLPTDRYAIVSVSVPPPGSPISKKLGEAVWQISDFVRSVNGGNFTAGDVFYELHKSERVQGNKALMVLEKATNKVFVGDGVRAMIGLSDSNQTVMPDHNKDYTIFVQSTSDNRHLKRHTRIIIRK